MVNLVAAVLKPLMHLLVRLAGLTPQTIEIEPGTIMKFWVPKQVLKKPGNQNCQTWHKPTKPVVVFAHPFSADGIFMWFFQALAFAGKYSVYIPDFLFFGGSATARAERSPEFQAECLATGLRKLAVESCTLVGLSYGGMVGFKMAELYPDLVENMVVSCTVVELTQSITDACLARIGLSRWSEFLLPESVEGVKLLFSVGTHKLPWLPDFFYRDLLEVMFDNRKEKAELLEALVVRDEEPTIPNYPQRIYCLWGDDDKIFNLELAQNMKERLGDKATLQWIKNAGHLAQMERPFAYNKQLKRILSSIYAQ
ncbi:unnamed protein product [Camellia sinensis]|uniref:AB hydrolase-1 domain-containing protein n=2 Tax=Camellia sinensis TaxID=4442 RepID=A0A7J7HGT1_CAMSI|nr:uncharacterized protein LOC114258499 isoform X3 [Camellia sinensis]KAF5951657.1 hypothetical protein HYC85_009601 [Camellia sinensis]THG21334.1 hypothetical protein TEA_015109 [Camellia sinensis var. sinensis]